MTTEILVIGRHEEIMQTLLRLINNNGQWNATIALSDEEAMRLFDSRHFHLVLLSGGIEPHAEQLLRTHFKSQDPSVIIIQHFGGGSGLLTNEIRQALDG